MWRSGGTVGNIWDRNSHSETSANADEEKLCGGIKNSLELQKQEGAGDKSGNKQTCWVLTSQSARQPARAVVGVLTGWLQAEYCGSQQVVACN